MYLAAVVDVVQEDVGEDVADPFRDHSVLAPVGNDAAVEIGFRQAVAEGDKLAVEIGLCRRQACHIVERHEGVIGGGAETAIRQEIEIETIDRENVVERFLDRGKETGALGLELPG